MINFEYFLQPAWLICRLIGFWDLSLKRIPFFYNLFLKIYSICFIIFHLVCSYYYFIHFDVLNFENGSLIVKYADVLVGFISILAFYFCIIYNFFKRSVWVDLINRLNLIPCHHFNILKERNIIVRQVICLVIYYTLSVVITVYYLKQSVKNLCYYNIVVGFVVVFLHFAEVILFHNFLKYIKSCLEEININLKHVALYSSNIEKAIAKLLEKYNTLLMIFSSLFSLFSFSTILFLSVSFISTTDYVYYGIKTVIAYFSGRKSEIGIVFCNMLHILIFFSHNFMNIYIVDATKKEVLD